MAPFNYRDTGWHQFTFTFDDDANQQVTYVDGEKMISKRNPKSIDYEGGGDTFIGIHGKSTKLNFRSQGIIDDLRVYDMPYPLQKLNHYSIVKNLRSH